MLVINLIGVIFYESKFSYFLSILSSIYDFLMCKIRPKLNETSIKVLLASLLCSFLVSI